MKIYNNLSCTFQMQIIVDNVGQKSSILEILKAKHIDSESISNNIRVFDNDREKLNRLEAVLENMPF